VGTSVAAAADFGAGMLVVGRSFAESVADCKIGLMVGIVIAVVGPSDAISIQPSRCVS